MTDGDPRNRALRDIADTYARYESSGYARRWSTGSEGYRLAVAERDRWIVEALVPYLAGTLVDLGCGAGALGQVLERAQVRPRRLLGFDVLEDRLEAARANVPWATFEAASADRLPVADGDADAVVAMTLLSSLTDPALRSGVAAEIGRVLRPSGAFVVYDLRYPSPRNRSIRPVSPRELNALFPGWTVRGSTLTLLPPLARSPLAAGQRRYRALAAIPMLRSHLGAVLVKPT
jgi:SAM-dependent methyltransferase